MRGELERYPDISFINGLMFEDFLNEMIANYEKKYQEITGQEIKLPAASPERLKLYSCAVMIYQGMQYIDRSGKNGLLKYSTGNFLDNLAALKKVERNPAIAASTKLKFILSKPQTFDVKIPIGTRTKVNELFFATVEAAVISSGEESTEVFAKCLTVGAEGNGYVPGTINILVDPINYVSAVVNVIETSGGADQEADDDLAERIYLAPSGYSTAGPEDAYQYWVRTYSQAIEDCYITSEQPGEVDIYIMLQGGMIPEGEQLSALKSYLEEGSKKPLTDHVEVKAPVLNEYEIDVTYYISDSDRGNEETIKKQIEVACAAFKEWQQGAIGRDINPSQLMYRLVSAGACYAVIRKPEWQEITTAQISKAKTVNLQYGGLKDARTL